jgi:hypothetical protein
MSRHDPAEEYHQGNVSERPWFDVFISTNNDKAIPSRSTGSPYLLLMEGLQDELSLPGEITIETLSDTGEILTEEEPDVDAEALYAVFREAAAILQR